MSFSKSEESLRLWLVSLPLALERFSLLGESWRAGGGDSWEGPAELEFNSAVR